MFTLKNKYTQANISYTSNINETQGPYKWNILLVLSVGYNNNCIEQFHEYAYISMAVFYRSERCTILILFLFK